MRRVLIAALVAALVGVPLAFAGTRHAAKYPSSMAVLGTPTAAGWGSRFCSPVPRRAGRLVGDGHEPDRPQRLLAAPCAEPCDQGAQR